MLYRFWKFDLKEMGLGAIKSSPEMIEVKVINFGSGKVSINFPFKIKLILHTEMCWYWWSIFWFGYLLHLLWSLSNFHSMFLSRSSLNVDHLVSRNRSSGQIEEKTYPSRSQCSVWFLFNLSEFLITLSN